MTTADTQEPVAPSRRRSRREILTGAAGALAAVVAAESIGAEKAYAGTDGDVVLGGSNVETTTTYIKNFTAGAIAIQGEAPIGNDSTGVVGAGGSDGTGVYGGGGNYGVYGAGGSYGVRGQGNVAGVLGLPLTNAADGLLGVTGSTSTGSGVHGSTQSGSGIGVLGEHASGGPGVRGTSGAGIGVEGYGGGSGIGVYGQGGPGGGNGVQGYAGSAAGYGAFGVNVYGGTGVFGASGAAGGVGVLGQGEAVGVRAQVTGSGVALDVQGPAKFSRSGRATVPAAANSVTVPGVALTADSLVLATVQQKAGGASVKSAVPNVAGSSITITLNKTPTVSVAVAWFVVN